MDSEMDFIPVLLGSDINVYGMARAFYERYGIKSTAYASVQFAPTKYSKIVNVETFPGFSEDPGFIENMTKIAKRYENVNKKVVLIACGDGYVELVSKHKAFLEKTFVVPYIDYDLVEQLISKEAFYEMADRYDLPHPLTKIISKADYENSVAKIEVPYEYPVALKPSNAVEWLDIKFEGRKKAFRIKDRAEFDDIVSKIYDHGYTADLILQDFIPGDDSNMRTLNCYVDQYHHVKLMCLGHPLLEDPTPADIGNYVAILPEYNQQVYDQIQHFLEAIKFTGFCNFDMKYDRRDQTFKLFEINLRQGRSSFFVTLNGYNLAEYVVEDRVTGALKDKPTVYGNQNESQQKLWLGVPVKVFKEYARDNADKQRALELLAAKRYGTTVFYKQDMNLKRYVLQKYAFYLYNGRFKNYFKENKGDM
ncbi:carboxylate--amine ligase [Loigolactobacillus coryniformis]|uniref:carboxylate--amine ligase n=1 Tax=Loigolactobacillus coryniformis TaxID=1610 RepID=UPI001C5FF8E8|nr:carboxylate--amine ligase [Loigolactobacillus coryniformis]MBW4804706.1 carboxylate--amine ligase [Loigolactobacillus coryniformis subsp. torquens]